MTIFRNERAYLQEVISRIISDHMRLTKEDAELFDNAERCLRMAFDDAEAYTNRIIVPTTATCNLHDFERIVELPTAPVSEIVQIEYYDECDKLRELDAHDYTVEVSEHRTLIEIFRRPELSARRETGRVRILFRGGYSDPQSKDAKFPLPGSIEAAIQLMAGTLAEADGDVIIGRQVNALPITAQRLLNPYRITPYGWEN